MLSNNLGRYSLQNNYHTNGYFNLEPGWGICVRSDSIICRSPTKIWPHVTLF